MQLFSLCWQDQDKMQQSLFDVEQAVQDNRLYFANKAKEKRELYYQSLPCPCEGEPKDENERMILEQWQWLRFNDETARDRFFKLSYEVLRRILWAEKKKRRLFLDEEQEMDAIATAFEYVFRRYTKGSGYYVKSNMILVLQGGIRHALDYRTKADEEISLDAFKGDCTKKIRHVF